MRAPNVASVQVLSLTTPKTRGTTLRVLGAPATEPAGDAASPVHMVALVLSMVLLTGAQIALVSRYLFARQAPVEGGASGTRITDLIWALAPGVLLAALVVYSFIAR